MKKKFVILENRLNEQNEEDSNALIKELRKKLENANEKIEVLQSSNENLAEEESNISNKTLLKNELENCKNNFQKQLKMMNFQINFKDSKIKEKDQEISNFIKI